MGKREVSLFDDGVYDELLDFNSNYFVSHLITYLGNKRKLLPFINDAVVKVKRQLRKEKITALDGFSGSGVVARLLKYHTTDLISNDFEQYSKTVNTVYLKNKSDVDIRHLKKAIEYLNTNKFKKTKSDYFITNNYAPADDADIKPGERVFYTHQNAEIIDNVRYMIDHDIDEDLRQYCVASLIIKASVHNNTSGVFKGFHKKNGIGHFGGASENALARIKGEIVLDMPIFAEAENSTTVYCEDTNELVKKMVPVDLAYFDPPYNQHPYGSNYFMLNIINGGKPIAVQDGVSGIAKEWQRSDYNKPVPAEKAMDDLIKNTKAKYILISYNDEGIIPIQKFQKIVAKYGEWELLEQEYNTYRGSRNLRERSNKVRELL
ncbi:MAG: DNA adenine methylase [Propionibacteriaceae bacterium]|jgi:adenine-specific DNA-methyltransferase|nr:DNA adenine methylase [Propionibacteriaceae bacterium]